MNNLLRNLFSFLSTIFFIFTIFSCSNDEPVNTEKNLVSTQIKEELKSIRSANYDYMLALKIHSALLNKYIKDNNLRSFTLNADDLTIKFSEAFILNKSLDYLRNGVGYSDAEILEIFGTFDNPLIISTSTALLNVAVEIDNDNYLDNILPFITDSKVFDCAAHALGVREVVNLFRGVTVNMSAKLVLKMTGKVISKAAIRMGFGYLAADSYL